MTTYSIGSYELDHNAVEVNIQNKRVGIVGFTTTVDASKLALVRFKFFDIPEGGDPSSMTYVWTETSLTGKIQNSKVMGYAFEVAFMFRGVRVKIPVMHGVSLR